jgi:tripartite-type tricarboxylate transporter receptor subunit TctC
MNQITRRHCLSILAAAAAITVPRWGRAVEAWPDRALRIVAGGPGSVTDIRARWLGERLAASLGQPIVVENNAAAGGNLGAQHVARSAADGYTLLLTHQGIATINPHLYAKLGFDPLTDLAPITRFGIGSLLTVSSAVPARSVKELIALARAKPGTLTYGTPGIGTPPHLASELFTRMAGIEATHVPFKGGGALASAMLGGHVGFSMDGLTAQLPHVRSGQLRALAGNRAPRPEAGLPGYEFSGWTGLAAPAGTPKEVIARLNAEIAKIAATPEARSWFDAGGAEAGIQSPEAFDAFIRAEHAKWGEVIRAAGIRIEG